VELALRARLAPEAVDRRRASCYQSWMDRESPSCLSSDKQIDIQFTRALDPQGGVDEEGILPVESERKWWAVKSCFQ